MALLRANDRLAAIPAECDLYLHGYHSSGIAILWSFLGGPRANPLVRRNWIGLVISLALFDAMHRGENVRLASQLAFRGWRGRAQRLRHLSWTIPAIQ